MIRAPHGIPFTFTAKQEDTIRSQASEIVLAFRSKRPGYRSDVVKAHSVMGRAIHHAFAQAHAEPDPKQNDLFG